MIKIDFTMVGIEGNKMTLCIYSEDDRILKILDLIKALNEDVELYINTGTLSQLTINTNENDYVLDVYNISNEE